MLTSKPSSQSFKRCLSKHQWSSLRGLLHLPQDLANEKFRMGDDVATALHLACRASAPLDIVDDIVQSHPQMVVTRTIKRGDTPLHYAVSHHCLPIVQYLLRQCPGCAAIRSEPDGAFGNQVTPLHVAIVSNLDPETIKLMIDARPEGLYMKDGKGKTPYMMALESYRGHNRMRVLRLLMTSNPSICQRWEAAIGLNIAIFILVLIQISHII